MKRALILAVVLCLLAIPSAGAAGKGKGRNQTSATVAASIAVASPAPVYGGEVWFSTTYEPIAETDTEFIYVLVVCTQGAAVVYQWSAMPDFVWPLVDQAGQGIEWDGGPADCTGSLIYRNDGGAAHIITILAQTSFAVEGAS